MSTRYQQLREAVANLAAPADLQVAYLDRIFVLCTGGGSAEAYGNDELVMEFDDIFLAIPHMKECGEIGECEIAAVRTLDDLFNVHFKGDDTDVWKRQALFDDPRWDKVREIATRVLDQLPDALRESDYARKLKDKSAARAIAALKPVGAIEKLTAFLFSGRQ